MHRKGVLYGIIKGLEIQRIRPADIPRISNIFPDQHRIIKTVKAVHKQSLRGTARRRQTHSKRFGGEGLTAGIHRAHAEEIKIARSQPANCRRCSSRRNPVVKTIAIFRFEHLVTLSSIAKKIIAGIIWRGVPTQLHLPPADVLHPKVRRRLRRQICRHAVFVRKIFDKALRIGAP